MPLDHDPVKAAANLEKHGVSFTDAEGALFGPMALGPPGDAQREKDL